MRAIEVLKELLLLSQDHLKSVMEEDWGSWERIHQVKGLRYKSLKDLMREGIGQGEAEIITEIERLEGQAKSELVKKKGETQIALMELRQSRHGIKGYRRDKTERGRRHFSIKI